MASLERTYRTMVEQRKITDATDLEDKDKDELKDISKALNKSTKAHAKQAKYLDKLVKKDKDTNEETNLEEGTWHVPETTKDIKKIVSILGKPLPVGDEENAYEGSEAEVGRKLNALGKAKVPIGDDRFYDEAYELSTKKGPRSDLRPLIIATLARLQIIDKVGTPQATISKLNHRLNSMHEQVNEAVTKSKRRAMDKKMFKKLVLNMGEETIEEAHSDKEVKMAIGIASDPRYAKGNMTGAVKAIEKMKKGLSSHPQVAAVLKRQNEQVKEMTKSDQEKACYKDKLDAKFAKLSPRAQTYANELMRKGDSSEYAIRMAKQKFNEQIEGNVEQVQTEPATNKSLFTGYINKLIKGEV